jgi:hypothetical protein
VSRSQENSARAVLDEIERLFGEVANAPDVLPPEGNQCWALGFSAAVRLVRHSTLISREAQPS